MVTPGGRARQPKGPTPRRDGAGIRKPPREYREGEQEGPRNGPQVGIRAPARRGKGVAGVRVVQTTTERLAREAMIRDPDTRIYRTGAPLATLRHVMYGCKGTPARSDLMSKIKEAVSKTETAVPLAKADVSANRAFRKILHEARTALEAKDEGALRESQWEALGDVLAGCVPDFCRNMQEQARREVVAAVVAGIKEAQKALLDLTDGWKRQHAAAVQRRADTTKARELLRTIVLAWRETTDERGARSLAKGGQGRQGGTGCLRLATESRPLPEAHTTTLTSHEVRHKSQLTGEWRVGKDPYNERATFATQEERTGLRNRRGKKESAVPAGSRARIFLTWMRLTGGPAFLRERRDKRNWEGRPPRKDRVGELEDARRQAGLTTETDRAWTGGGIGSREHTATRQQTERASILFAEANASAHQRGARVRLTMQSRDAPAKRSYRHRPPPPLPSQGAQAQDLEATTGALTPHTQADPADEASQAHEDELDGEIADLESNERAMNGWQPDSDPGWLLEMEVEADLEEGRLRGRGTRGGGTGGGNDGNSKDGGECGRSESGGGAEAGREGEGRGGSESEGEGEGASGARTEGGVEGGGGEGDILDHRGGEGGGGPRDGGEGGSAGGGSEDRDAARAENGPPALREGGQENHRHWEEQHSHGREQGQGIVVSPEAAKAKQGTPRAARERRRAPTTGADRAEEEGAEATDTNGTSRGPPGRTHSDTTDSGASARAQQRHLPRGKGTTRNGSHGQGEGSGRGGTGEGAREAEGSKHKRSQPGLLAAASTRGRKRAAAGMETGEWTGRPGRGKDRTETAGEGLGGSLGDGTSRRFAEGGPEARTEGGRAADKARANESGDELGSTRAKRQRVHPPATTGDVGTPGGVRVGEAAEPGDDAGDSTAGARGSGAAGDAGGKAAAGMGHRAAERARYRAAVNTGGHRPESASRSAEGTGRYSATTHEAPAATGHRVTAGAGGSDAAGQGCSATPVDTTGTGQDASAGRRRSAAAGAGHSTTAESRTAEGSGRGARAAHGTGSGPRGGARAGGRPLGRGRGVAWAGEAEVALAWVDVTRVAAA